MQGVLPGLYTMWFECAMRVRKVRYYLSRFGHMLVAMFFVSAFSHLGAALLVLASPEQAIR